MEQVVLEVKVGHWSINGARVQKTTGATFPDLAKIVSMEESALFANR